MTQVKSEKLTDWTVKMALLYQSFKQHGDDQNADKLRAWYKKLVFDKNVMLAFCGHFSAGKSSLLNKIMRSQLLPSSPIPTSGNLVRIKGGAPSMQLETRAGETVVLPEHYPMEKLHDLLKDSDYIRRIDLQVGGSFPQGVELFDTPGVDSTDERHHQSTNEALHLADAVFYVTDYNHVLSDVNFNFLKTLAQLGKPFYLIVNQIDKHNEKEGSFASFKTHVENALNDWQLYPKKIFYLSLVNEKIAGNDFQAFLAFLDDMMEGKAADHEDLLQGLKTLAEQHRIFLKNQFEQSLKEKRIDSVPDDDALQKLDKERKALQAEIARLDEQKESWLQQTSDDISKAISSAILMPFEVREAAKSYAASLDPHFKIGFFAGKRKTEEERKRRLDVYLEKYQKQVQTLEWAVRDTIVRAGRNAEVISESDLGSLYGLSIEGLQKIVTEALTGNIETNGAFMLHYTEDVSDETKRKMRTQAMVVVSELEKLIHERTDEKAAPLRKQFVEENERYQTLQTAMVEKLALEAAEKQLDDIFAAGESASDADKAVQALAEEIEEKESGKRVLTIDEYRRKYLLPKASEEQQADKEALIQDDAPKKNKTPRTGKPANADLPRQLSQAAQILRPIDGFQNAADYLVQTAERVKHKTFTIALFGAFSAGKSSFANALLGEAILPVSPNPTTAVINHIRQSTPEHPNRSTVVRIKSEQTLLDEINQSLALFDKRIDGLSELKPLLPHLESKRSDTKGHQHVSLLLNLADAIERFEGEWGSTLEMSLPESHQMVANEKIACLIESVTMYYDCPFTKQGNVLVDTPGASSIHARHTEVAFHYIKNADAILFLTYFNHAFSRSDREFLIQLGRVKDTFSLDKMFFVINAIDLAQTEQERKDVAAYVKAQLLTFGIRHPKLYGVSSKQALLERQNGGALTDASGMGPFIREWNKYAEQELLMQVAESGLKTIRQSAQQMQRWLDDLQLDGEAKEERIQALTRQKNEVGQALEKLPIEKKAPEIHQHIDEWFFYIKKRLVQRYIDEFSQFFNPALFFEQTLSNKEVLYQGLKDCIEFLSFDLDQECRAAFLRIEALLKKELARLFEKCEQISAELSGSAGVAVNEPSFGHPDLPGHLKDINLKPLTAAFKFYKNPKQFFEKDGKKLMRDNMQELLEPYLADMIEKNGESAKAHYLPLFYDEAGRLTETFKKQAEQAADYTIKMLQADHQPMIALLEKARQDLADLLAD